MDEGRKRAPIDKGLVHGNYIGNRGMLILVNTGAMYGVWDLIAPYGHQVGIRVWSVL